MLPASIAGFGPIILPEHRAARVEMPWWEGQRLHAMRHFVEPGMNLLEVGAEEGDMTALYASWGLNVLLVEPNEKSWPWIRRIFEANDLTDRLLGTFVGLCGAHNDEAGLGLRFSPGWPECSVDENPTPEHGFRHLAENAPDIPVVTIDHLSDRAPGLVKLNVLTVDVEGGELLAMQGASRVLDYHRPVVVMSIHPGFMADLYDQHPMELHSLMVQHDYRGKYLCTDHEQHWIFLPAEHPFWERAHPSDPRDVPS